MPKYLPYSCTMRSAATFDTPNSECVQWSIDIVVSIPPWYSWSAGSSSRVSVSYSGRRFGWSP